MGGANTLFKAAETSSAAPAVNPLLTLVVQSLSRVQLLRTPWTATHQASLSFTVSQSLLKLMSIEWMMPSHHLILCHPLLLLLSIFPRIRVFYSISPFNEYSRLVSFRIDWFDLLAVQGILKSLL